MTKVKCQCGREFDLPEDRQLWMKLGKEEGIRDVMKLLNGIYQDGKEI